MTSHLDTGAPNPSVNQQDTFAPAPWSFLSLRTRQPDRGHEAILFSRHYERNLRHLSTPLADDDTLHQLAGNSNPAASSQDTQADAGERNQMYWMERLAYIPPAITPVPATQRASFLNVDTSSWQRGNRNWLDQQLWLLDLRSQARSSLGRLSSDSRALSEQQTAQQTTQQTVESDVWLEARRAEQTLEDLRIRGEQLYAEMNLFIEGWRARRDAEERLAWQRFDSERTPEECEGELDQGESGEGESEEEELGEEESGEEEEQLARSRSKQQEWEERQWIEETWAEMKDLSSGSRRVSGSSSIPFLDLSV